MRRVEPILNNMMQPRFKVYWWADASNGFFAVPMYPPHAYKTGFSCFLGQFCYLRMAQGLCGAPHTFAQLKDYVGGPIPHQQNKNPSGRRFWCHWSLWELRKTFRAPAVSGSEPEYFVLPYKSMGAPYQLSCSLP